MSNIIDFPKLKKASDEAEESKKNLLYNILNSRCKTRFIKDRYGRIFIVDQYGIEVAGED